MLHVHFFIRGAIFTDITRNRSTLILNLVLPMHTSSSSSLPFLRNYFPRDEVDRIQITLASMFIAFVLYYSSLYRCRPFGSLRSGFYLFFLRGRGHFQLSLGFFFIFPYPVTHPTLSLFAAILASPYLQSNCPLQYLL